jgi:uncharacterized protein (TIGR03437 family)
MSNGPPRIEQVENANEDVAYIPSKFPRCGNYTGTGQGAIVNQDGTVNSAANPAARGSVVSIYGTGLSAEAEVMIGGLASVVQYAGQTPGEIAGLTQVNAVVPQGASVGATVAVVVGIGGVQSQIGVTVAVK